ncbi:MAG: aminopeptidase P family protein [Endomicrobia bacterium]|nr:aminopeptidase P family protein [Endomicrobiia bacterium]MCL2507456.1 aminopeptidase P family protein [Endomicrobiia bacterium]
MKEKIAKLYEKYKTDAFVFANKTETFYLSGAQFDGFWILAVKDEIFVLCSKMIENQVKEYFGKKGIHIYIGMPFEKSVYKILKDKNIKNVTADASYMTAEDFFDLSDNLKKLNIKLFRKNGILNDLRIVKTDQEAEYIKESCRIVSKICNIIKKELKPGITEIDVHYRIMELFALNNVKESFTPIVASGSNSANPHHASSNRKIAKNDIVMIDLGCVYKGYCSDLTRTYYLGKINHKFAEIFEIVKKSQDSVIKNIKAGLPFSWADKTARNIISSYGYKDKFIHTTGHGIGIEIHEIPSLSSNAEGVFLQNTAITVEPGIYLEGKFGVRIEDTVIVTENGCEVLTSASY